MRWSLHKFWETFRSSFWFLPTVMGMVATVLAFGCVALDEWLKPESINDAWVYAGAPEGARAVLSVVAGSMITVAGTVFSITIVALTLASSQFGPRLLRNFMRDTSNQLVLGTFTSTFLYCLLVLRTVRGLDDDEFVPHVSITVGVVLAVASLGVLIYFIHHAAMSIQVMHLINGVSEELGISIKRLFPDELGEGLDQSEVDARRDDERGCRDTASAPVRAHRSGYLQLIEDDRLMEIANARNVCIQLRHRPGQFVVAETVLADVSPAALVDDEFAEKVNRTMVLGAERTATQDVEFAVSQLVEVALRALSPGINDPYTAINCIDWLGASLCKLTRRRLPSAERYNAEGQLRVVAPPVTFAGILDAAFNEIRQAARTNAAVTIRLLEVLERVIDHARRRDDLRQLARHAVMIYRASQEGLAEEFDRADAEARYQALRETIERKSADLGGTVVGT